jgi:glycosyltransferase involved in cell wall biosynthesis
VVLDGKTGLLVPPHDPVALCQAMQKLLSEPENAIEMGANGRKRAMETFLLEQNMDQYEAIYREIAR